MSIKTVGFIGLGLMGEAMSKNIVAKFGGDVWVFDVNPQAIATLVSAGATAASSIADIAQRCDVIISMVPKSEHVQAVYRELLPHLHAGQITLDMSTIDPEVSVELARQVQQTGAQMLDAPVVKSVPAAIAAELGIYVGGDLAAYQRVRPLLAMMGNNIIHLGDNGRGLVMKLCHNTLVAQIQNGVNEMLTLAHQFGISTPDFATAASYGGASNFYLSGKLNALSEENYQTAFSLQNMGKDIDCTLRLMRDPALNLPGVDTVKAVYDYAIAHDMGPEDFCATIKAVKARAVGA
ncbi:MAG: NAD(P)-dependent oxidoreductase [Plesiomonas sp.]